MSSPSNESSPPSKIQYTDSPSPSTDASQSIENYYKEQGYGSKKQYICSFTDCQKIFRFRSEIKRHIASHTDFRPHGCNFPGCNKSFKRIEALDDHVRSRHTGEAPLTCSYAGCGLKFTTYAKLRYHTVLHGGEKPYKCCFEGCDRAFVTLSQLKQHERSSPMHKKSETTLVKREQTSYESSVTVPINSNEVNDPIKKLKISQSESSSECSKTEPMCVSDKTMKFEDDTCQIPNKSLIDQKYIFAEERNPTMVHQVVLENESLKRRLELSQNLIKMMKEQMDRFATILPDEIHKRAMLMYGPNYFFNNLNLQYPQIFQ